jgi:predicted anti-sigma-YlaC factor YlaD
MNCPSFETLDQFLSGSSPGPAAVEAHLAACSNCRSTLDRLSDNPDLRRWVSRALELPTALSEDPVLVRVLTELQTASGEFSRT